jgi:ribonuclease HI
MSKTISSISSIQTQEYYVYTDGACSKNESIDAKEGIGIYFGKSSKKRRTSLKLSDS